MECVVTFHLQTMFRYDAFKAQRFYISNDLKKPNRVLIRDFVQQIQCLNSYLELLPCLNYSYRASKSTKIIKPFDDSVLASHILKLVPRTDRSSVSTVEPPYKVSGTSLKSLTTSKSLSSQQQHSLRPELNQVTLPKEDGLLRSKNCLLCKKHGSLEVQI